MGLDIGGTEQAGDTPGLQPARSGATKRRLSGQVGCQQARAHRPPPRSTALTSPRSGESGQCAAPAAAALGWVEWDVFSGWAEWSGCWQSSRWDPEWWLSAPSSGVSGVCGVLVGAVVVTGVSNGSTPPVPAKPGRAHICSHLENRRRSAAADADADADAEEATAA